MLMRDDGSVEPAHETNGIGSNGIEDSSVVERDERHVGARNPPRQGGLSRLPGTADENDSGVGERLPDTAFDETRVQRRFLEFRPIERSTPTI